MRLHLSTPMPRREQDTTVAAVVVYVFQAVDHVGDEAEAESKEKCYQGPDTKCRGNQVSE